MSEPVPYGFEVEMDDDGAPRITLTALSAALPALGKGHLSFALREDITEEEAQELVDDLNEKIAGIVYIG
jgi:hypothetical protein